MKKGELKKHRAKLAAMGRAANAATQATVQGTKRTLFVRFITRTLSTSPPLNPQPQVRTIATTTR